MPEDTSAASSSGSVEEKPCSSAAAAAADSSADVMEEAKKLIGTGNRHLVMGDIVSAVAVFQDACSMLAARYGDTADECGEAFFLCGKSLLELARMENGVLGNALEGVPEESEEEEQQQQKPGNSNIESADNLDEKTRDDLRRQVYDAMAEQKTTPADGNLPSSEAEKSACELPSSEAEKSAGELPSSEAENGAGELPSSEAENGAGELPSSEAENGAGELPSSEAENGAGELPSSEAENGAGELPSSEGTKSAWELPSSEAENGAGELPSSEGTKSAWELPSSEAENGAGELSSEGEKSAGELPSSEGTNGAGKLPLSEGEKSACELPSSEAEKSAGELPSSEEVKSDATKAIVKVKSPVKILLNGLELPSDVMNEAAASSLQEVAEKEAEESSDTPVNRPADVAPGGETGSDKVESTEEKSCVNEAEPEDQKDGDSTLEADQDGEEPQDDDDADDDDDDDDDDEDGEGKEQNKEEDEVGNLQLAWEMLEVAKFIYKRKEGKDDQLMAAQAYLKLGEVSAESGNYPQALEDFQECLALQLKHLPPHSRLLAETHYHVATTLCYMDEYSQAIQHYNSSIKVIETRVAMLQEVIDAAEGADGVAKEKNEMEELKLLLPDIREKVEDAKESQRTASAASQAIQQTLAGASTSSAFPCENGGPSSSTAAFPTTSQVPVKTESSEKSSSSKVVSDISHLVRKKRKPEDESPVKDTDAKQAKQESTVNGSADSNASNGKGVQEGKSQEPASQSASVGSSA